MRDFSQDGVPRLVDEFLVEAHELEPGEFADGLQARRSIIIGALFLRGWYTLKIAAPQSPINLLGVRLELGNGVLMARLETDGEYDWIKFFGDGVFLRKV